MKKQVKLLMISSLLILTTSCASFAGLGGKAHYVQTFEDVTAVDQKTSYRLDIKGPAGMKWEEITGMAYEWDQENGKIAINSQSKADTIATAEAIKAVVPVLTETIGNAVSAGIANAISSIMPVVQQKIIGDQANEAARIEGRTENVGRAIERLPQPTPTPTPPVTPPAVVPPVVDNPITDVVPPVAPPLGPNN